MVTSEATPRTRSAVRRLGILPAAAAAFLLFGACASGGGPRPSAPPAGGESAGGAGAQAPADTTRPARPAAEAPAGAEGVSGPAASEQVPGTAELVDRIVAVVGDTALLYSEVQQEIIRRQSQNQLQMPQDPAARDSIFRAISRELVDQLILLHGAREAGIEITPDELERVVDQRFQEIRNRFGSTQEFRTAVEQTGQNMYQFRQGLESRVRAELAIQRFLQQNRDQLPPAPVDEEEIRQEYRQRWADRQGPATVTLRRLLVEPDADSMARERALARADSALEELRSGTEFAVAVRRYSDDPGSRSQEGDLGWVRRSEVLPSFGDAAWRAPLGRPVGPVETRYGYHILEVQNVRGGERKIRHILLRPEIDESDVEAARSRAEALVDSLRSGAEFDRLAEAYGDAPANREAEVEIPVQEIQSRLGPAYASALQNVQGGDVVGPIEVTGSAGETAFAVVKITAYRASGRYELEEVREQIREYLVQQKQYQRFLDRLRDEIYVQILI